MYAIRNVSTPRLEGLNAKGVEFLGRGHGFNDLGHAARTALLSETKQFGMVRANAVDKLLLQGLLICSDDENRADCGSTCRLIGGLSRINLKLRRQRVLKVRGRGRRFGK